MSKQSSSSTLKQIPLIADDMIEHRLVEWLSANKHYILMALVALLALTVISYRWIAARTLKSEADFFQAQAIFNRFQDKGLKNGEIASSLEELGQLELFLKRHPELQAKYDGLVAQTLLIEQQPERARPFAQSAFQRIAVNHLDFYQDYAQTSLLISEGNYTEAAQRTQQLKGKMGAEQAAGSFGETLYLFNLLRLAMLYQQLNQPQEEKLQWEELQRYSSSGDALRSIHQLFKEGKTSLRQYIEERNKFLSFE